MVIRLMTVSKKMLMLVSLVWFGAVQAAVDVPGSRDLSQLKRYPLSTIGYYQETVVPEYSLALGRIKKVNGVVFPDEQEYLTGKLTRITYRIPGGHGTSEVIAHARQQLEQQGATILFSCESRGCGSSNDWANRQFGIPTLYGPDREQQYLAAKLDANTFMAVYVTQRGNRQVLQHVEMMRTEVTDHRLSAEEISQRWQQGERVFVAAKDWPEEQLEVLAVAIQEIMDQRPFSKVWLVGHANGRNPFLILINDGKLAADRLRQQLQKRGLPENRIMTYSVGPLAPAYADVPEQRIELLVE